jgi:hypothetical protein
MIISAMYHSLLRITTLSWETSKMKRKVLTTISAMLMDQKRKIALPSQVKMIKVQ